MDDPEIIELTPQPTAAIRITQPMAALDLASAFDHGMPLVASGSRRRAEASPARRTVDITASGRTSSTSRSGSRSWVRRISRRSMTCRVVRSADPSSRAAPWPRLCTLGRTTA